MRVTRVSEDEYLRLERAAEYKSEYIGGEIFGMAGGSPRHSEIAANWIGFLWAKLPRTRCRLFTSDLRVRIANTGDYVYPDVSVVCDEAKFHGPSADALTNPVLLVEVLSPSTADYDRGKKFELYRQIDSLQDYIMSDSKSPRVEHLHRQPDSSWIFREYRGLESVVEIPSIGCTVPLAEIYSGALELP